MLHWYIIKDIPDLLEQYELEREMLLSFYRVTGMVPGHNSLRRSK